MRYNPFLILSLFAPVAYVISTRNPAAILMTDGEDMLTSGAALFIYGLIAGIIICALAKGLMDIYGKRMRKTQPAQQAENRAAANKNSFDRQVEMRIFQLEDKLKEWQNKCSELQRQLDEAEQLSRVAAREKGAGYRKEEDADKVGINDVSAASASPLKLYFMQPTMDGWFRETGKVEDPAEAVYELSCHENDPFIASIKFIDTPSNVSLALQNEATWILIACERSTIASPVTSSITTETPGIAGLKNGEWEIVQKAKVIYI